MIANLNSQSLVQIAREGTAQQFAAALKETGTAVLGNAVETFCQMDRETKQGATSVEQLKDLKNALMVSINRNQQEMEANLAGPKELAQSIKDGKNSQFKLEQATVEDLVNTPSKLKGGDQVHPFLRREWGAECAELHLPATDALTGTKKFLADLSAVQGLYTAAVMIPGPLSLTVKNFAREVASSQFQSSSNASGNSQSKGFLSRANSSFRESSQAEGSQQYDKTTVDERVVPVLSELQDRLGQVSVVPSSSGSLSLDRHLTESSGKKGFFSSKINYDQQVAHTYYNQDRLQRPVTEFAVQPEHIRLPETSISDYLAK